MINEAASMDIKAMAATKLCQIKPKECIPDVTY